MAHTRSSKSRRVRKVAVVHKPRGVLHPRVRQVGPEHFGIVSVDCAKARSEWMLCNFYGQVLLPSATVTHTQGHLMLAIVQLRQAIEENDLKDLIVAIERTGNYHLPVKRAFRRPTLRLGSSIPLRPSNFDW
jgi:hypothetical protein